MEKVQVNLRIEKDLIEKVDMLVRQGFFKNRTEAFLVALNRLIKDCLKEFLRKKLDKIRQGTEKYPSPTDVIIKMHEEKE